MSMDNQDFQRVFNDLSSTLTQQGLGWIVSEVIDVINEGQISTVKVETFKETLSDSGVEREIQRASIAEFLSVVEYTPQEQLLLLLEAIEQTLVQTAAMEQEIAEFFENETARNSNAPRKAPTSDVVVLASELSTEDLTDDNYSVVRPSNARVHQEQAQRLQSLINALRREVNDV